MALSLPHPYTAIKGLHGSRSSDAKQVLHNAYAAAHVNARPLAPQEPDYVAELIRTGVTALATAWRPHFSSLGLMIDLLGVFIHQSPMVDFHDATRNPARCELGDLLLAVRFPNAPPLRALPFLHKQRWRGRQSLDWLAPINTIFTLLGPTLILRTLRTPKSQ